MQYDDPPNVFADIGVLIPNRIPEMAVCVSISGSSEQLRCRPRRGSAERIKTALLTRLSVILRSAKVDSFGVRSQHIQRHHRAAGQHRHVSVR
jgi:hypothetical protein